MKCILLLSLLMPAAVFAQARRSIQPLELWPEVQSELVLKNGDYLLLALRGDYIADADYRAGNRLGFNAGRVRLGYEHFWTAHWSWGATSELRGATGSGSATNFVPEVLLRHRSPVGPLTFGQRLSLERTIPLGKYIGGAGPESKTNVRLRFDLEKLLPVGALTLRPRLSYEAVTHIRLQKDEIDESERAFQFTSLRAEIGCRVSSLLDFTPWFAYQTTYINSLNLPTGPTNLVRPTLGLDLRFTLLPTIGVSDRQQLPTQH